MTRASPTPNPPVVLNDLVLSYGNKAVLNGLSWSLQPGQVVGLLGRNGAGKTTLLQAMLGLLPTQRGQATVFGDTAEKLSDATRARIGYVPQRGDLLEDFSAPQLLAYFKSFYPRWNTAKVDGLLSRWHIPLNLPIARLSGGEQQRLSIIRALAHEPDLLVLDEPVASLDPAGRRDFLRELVDQVLDRGTTVVLSTHILSDLQRVAFDVAFMRDGRIALQAPLDQLLGQTRQVVGTTDALAALLQNHAGHVLQRRPLSAGQEACVVRFDNSVPAASSAVSVDAVNLEDLFVELA